MLRKVAAVVAVAVGATFGSLLIGAAGAGTVAPAATVAPGSATVYSPEQAGYITGGGWRFRWVTTTFKVPDAAQFATNVAGLGFSVQLRSATKSLVVGVSNLTTTASGWSPAVAVFDGHTFVASPSTTSGWTGFISEGDSVTESIFYNRTLQTADFAVTDNTSGVIWRAAFKLPGGVNFTAAVVGAEFSVTPFSFPDRFKAPIADVGLTTFRGTHVTTYNVTRGTLLGPWTTSKVIMTNTGTVPGTILASAGGLFNGGQNFTDWLRH